VQMRTPLSIRMAERNSAMERIILDAEAGQVSAELVRRGIADARVHVLVEVQVPRSCLRQRSLMRGCLRLACGRV